MNQKIILRKLEIEGIFEFNQTDSIIKESKDNYVVVSNDFNFDNGLEWFSLKDLRCFLKENSSYFHDSTSEQRYQKEHYKKKTTISSNEMIENMPSTLSKYEKETLFLKKELAAKTANKLIENDLIENYDYNTFINSVI